LQYLQLFGENNVTSQSQKTKNPDGCVEIDPGGPGSAHGQGDGGDELLVGIHSLTSFIISSLFLPLILTFGEMVVKKLTIFRGEVELDLDLMEQGNSTFFWMFLDEFRKGADGLFHLVSRALGR